jgi:hypothetical protein
MGVLIDPDNVCTSGAFGIADGIGGEGNDTAWWRAFILYFYQIVFGLILLGALLSSPPAAQWRPYSIARPMEPPCSSQKPREFCG